MKPVSFFFYEARLVSGLSALLPCLGLPAYAILSRLLWGRYDQISPVSLHNTFVIVLPLAAGLSAAHLMSIEVEEGFDELRRSYPEPRLYLPLLRSASALAFLLLALILGSVAFWWAWGPWDFNLVPTLLPAIPPGVFLSGLSLLIGGLSRSYWAAAGAMMGWWFLELQTRGQLTDALFLFHAVWPRTGIAPELNQTLLFGIGVIFFLLNALVYVFREEWNVRRRTFGAG